jgi:DNA-binding NarL/FixJ family response regulator
MPADADGERVWAVDENRGGEVRQALGATEESILELLLTGAPDKAIAARLGVTERTVQRRIRTLMIAVGADNRMQLGALTSRRGMTVPGVPPARPDETEVLLLKLLMTGLSERSAAAGLEIGHRTAQRRIRRLMALVGAANRAQLGWHAEHHGWI